jgi:hypothetical protein
LGKGKGRGAASKLLTDDLPPSPSFEIFWKVYPPGTPRLPAIKTWVGKRLDAHVDKIVAEVEWRKQHDDRWKNPKFIPNAATYLNQERWKDARPEQIVEQKRLVM